MTEQPHNCRRFIDAINLFNRGCSTKLEVEFPMFDLGVCVYVVLLQPDRYLTMAEEASGAKRSFLDKSFGRRGWARVHDIIVGVPLDMYYDVGGGKQAMRRRCVWIFSCGHESSSHGRESLLTYLLTYLEQGQ